MDLKTSSYQSVRDRMRTGDLVFFDGKGVVSWGIKRFSGSRWSHVGTVLRIPEYDFVCLLESTTLGNLRDLETGVFRKGVQTVPLEERIRTYDGAVAWQPLVGEHDRDVNHRAMRFRHAVKGLPYERKLVDMIQSVLPGFLDNTDEDLTSLFCSELAVEFGQALKHFDERVVSSNYTPGELFYGSGALKDLLQFGFVFGEPLILETR